MKVHKFTETGEVRKANLSHECEEVKWKPKVGKTYYTITEFGTVKRWIYCDNSIGNDAFRLENKRLDFGNCFPTKAEAESKLKKIKEILK